MRLSTARHTELTIDTNGPSVWRVFKNDSKYLLGRRGRTQRRLYIRAVLPPSPSHTLRDS